MLTKILPRRIKKDEVGKDDGERKDLGTTDKNRDVTIKTPMLVN